jgi:hypothetical protein
VTVAVPVAGAVAEAPGVTRLPGAAQPASTDKNKSQQISFTFCCLEKGRVGIIEGMAGNQGIQSKNNRRFLMYTMDLIRGLFHRIFCLPEGFTKWLCTGIISVENNHPCKQSFNAKTI